MTPALREACARAVHVVRADGTVLRAGRAVLFILSEIEGAGWRWAARVLRLPPLVWAVELGYYLVARNRRWLGRFLLRKERRELP